MHPEQLFTLFLLGSFGRKKCFNTARTTVAVFELHSIVEESTCLHSLRSNGAPFRFYTIQEHRCTLNVSLEMIALNLITNATPMPKAENTHLLCKGKYHCMADLLFDWFVFDQTCKYLSKSTKAKQLNPNRSNRRSAIQ